MKLGVLGGTFDPIHVGHLLIAEITRETLNLDRVLVAPAGDPPHKQGVEKTASQHRQKMVELAIETNPFFELSRVDLNRPGPHYSVDTVQLICAQYKIDSEACHFIIGGDSLVDLPKWYKPELLIKLCRLAVVHRPDYQPNISKLRKIFPSLETRIDWVQIPVVNFSASNIRVRVAAGQSIRYQVPEQVAQYIKEHNLYQNRLQNS